VALQSATTTGAGIEEAALRALTTVRQVMPSRLRQRMDAVEFTTLPRSNAGPASPVAPEVLIALSGAVRAREVLRFDYASGRTNADDRIPRRVEPHHLVAATGRWYLVAWDLAHNDWRIFRADRISPRVPTGPRFGPREVPGGSARDFVAARFKGSADSDSWPCTGTVILHLPASAVLPFAGDGSVKPLGPDRCEYTVGAWSWVALAASLGRFDTAIDVVKPPELTAAFGVLAARNAATATAAS
ncbi:MAG: WYL domain-containing protein, partial [Glaciihabitans sp.]